MNTGEHTFQVAHIGLNTKNSNEARKAAGMLRFIFGLEITEGETSTYAGPMLEIMKGVGRGKHGHIALATADLSGAIDHLQSRGIQFDDTSGKYDAAGNLILLYLQEEIAGFAFHLIRA